MKLKLAISWFLRTFEAHSDCTEIMRHYRPNALALANYILDLAEEKEIKLELLKLMKLTYIAHGFILALLGKERSALDPRFDKVEAWKYGPVIPSVYHSFKLYANSPITEKTKILVPSDDGKEGKPVEPVLEDEEQKRACKIAFLYFYKFSGSELVDMLHAHGTPWEAYYQEGQNNEIPDDITYLYYDSVINNLISIKNGESNSNR